MGVFRWISGAVTCLAVAAQPSAAQGVAEVQVSPPTVTLSVGQDGGVFATAYDASGNVLVGQQFRWTSSNPNVVRVTGDETSSDVATLVAVNPGVARVEARIGSRSGTAAVQVVATGGVPGGGPSQTGTGQPTVIQIEPGNILMLPAESRQLLPVFFKDDGSLAAPTTVTWRSLNASVATVSDDALVVAISQGQGIIEVSTSGGLVARAPVQVSSAPFEFSPSVLSLSPGVETTVEVVVASQGGRSLPNNALSWRSSDESVVRVTQLGVAIAVAAGRATITASGFLQEQTLPVRVHRPVTELTALPRPSGGPVAAPMGGTVQFEVRALAEDGTPVPEAPLIWTVHDTSIASFDGASQVLSGSAIGETELHLVGPPGIPEVTWQIDVIAGGLLADPRRFGIGVGETLAVEVTFTDQAGTPVGPATSVTWVSSDTNVASVTASGVVTGTGVGTAAVIAATPWGSVDTARVFVQGELLIASTREGTHDLYTLDRASPGVLNPVVIDPAVDAAGAFSPDGSRIAFVSSRDGSLDVYVANADGTDPQRLTTTEDANEDGPTWTPDGAEIVYVSQPRRQRGQIWIMNADGSNQRQLTSGEATNFEPAVSPDGGTIAFTSTRDGNYEIYLMGTDGTDQRNVTQSAPKESHAAWFPDGQLAYVREQTSGSTVAAQVIRHDLTGGTASPVSPEGLAVTDFAIAPDGGELALEVSAFESGGGISRKIYLMEVVLGAAPVELPRQDAAEQQSGPAFRTFRR